MGPGAQKIASCLLFLLGVLLVIVPGICSWTWSFPRDSAEQRLAWGSVLGIGAAVYLANVCAFGQLSWFYPLWAGLLILSVGSFALRPGKLRVSLWNPSEGAAGSATHASSAPANIPETEANVHPALSTLHEADWSSKLAASPKRVLVLLLLLIALVEIASVRRQVVPPGFDPSFHLLLAKKIALTNHIIRDWQPFENATLNYPLGSHYLIVLFGGFCGLPLPRVFQLLMVTLSLLSALAVYALGLEYFESEQVGLYGAIAYGLWAFVGSADYLRWGGLPNQLGMLLGLGIFSLVIRAGDERKRLAVMALLFASVCLTHHHVMLTMGSILIALTLFFLITKDPERRYRTTFFALVMGSIASSFFLIPYVLKATSLTQTNVFHMDDTWPVLGVVLVGFALDGLVLDYSRRRDKPHVFHLVSAILMLLYLLFAWVYYYYRLEIKGEGFVAFTPSRFVTDLVYVLSLFAGYSLYRIRKDRGWSARTTIAIALMLGTVNYPLWQQVFDRDGDRGRFAAYDWIANHTPANSIVMTTEPWAPYGAWRRTLGTPRPVSEPRVAPRISAEANRELLAGGSPEELRGIELLGVFKPGERTTGRLLWSSPGGWAVTEVYPR